MAISAVDSMWKRGSSSSVSRGGFSGTSGKIPSRSIPPSGTSARKAYDKTMSAGTGVPKTTKERLTGTYNYPAKPIVSKVVDPLTRSSSSSSPRKRSSGGSSGGSYGGSSGGSYGGSSAPASSAQKELDYYEAPITKVYGFNKATAYQEALANTAYRREMDDMRKAGLNPSVIYGDHNTSGASSSIYPDVDVPASGGYSSGGSGGRGRRSRGGNSGKYVFSGGAYYGIMAGVGAITAMATHNVGAGMAAAGLAGTAMKAINGFLKK